MSNDARDAALWRALIGSARIRPLGNAGLGEPRPDNYAHLGLELWTVFSREGYKLELVQNLEYEQKLGQMWLTEYAEIAAKAQGIYMPPDFAKIGAYFILDDAMSDGREGFVVMHGNPQTAVGTFQFEALTLRRCKEWVKPHLVRCETVYRVKLARRHGEFSCVPLSLE